MIHFPETIGFKAQKTCGGTKLSVHPSTEHLCRLDYFRAKHGRHGSILSKAWLPSLASAPTKTSCKLATSLQPLASQPQRSFKPLAFDSAGPGQVGLLELTDILQDFLAHAKGPRRHCLAWPWQEHSTIRNSRRRREGT